MSRFAPLAVILFSTLVAACGGSGVGRFAESREGECPRVTILGDADHVSVFNGSGRDLPDLRFSATITDLSSQCDYGREWGRRYSYAQLQIDFSASLGTAAVARPVDIPYFVAVILPDDEIILTKEVFTVRAGFTSNYRSVTLRDNIDQVRIPVEEIDEAGEYEIIVGFELSPEQLAFNRRRSQ